MTVASKLWKVIGYEPHEGQMAFHASDARFKVPVAGRRWGKSRAASAEVEPDLLDSGRKVPCRGWIVGPQYSDGEKEFRYLWDDLVINMGLGPHIPRKAYNARTGEMYIQFPWGARVDVRSADRPDGLVGEGLDFVVMSEAAKQSPIVWEKYLRPALADRRGKAIFPSTPEGFNWFYNLYRDGQDRVRHPDWESWRLPSWENHYVYPGGFNDPEIQSQLRTPDDPWFWQEIGADFRSVVGLIYPEWNDQLHIKPWKYNPLVDNYLFIDFGYTNPTCVLDVQVTPSEDVYIWREYYVRGKTAHTNAMILRSRANPEDYKVDCGFGDAADPQAIEEYSTYLAPTMADPESKDWARGVQAVKRFLRSDDGNPRLFVDPSCVNTIREFNSYKMKQPARNKQDPRENLKEEPQKKDDHAMDAIRYGIMHLFELGAQIHADRLLEMVGAEGMGDGTIFSFGAGSGEPSPANSIFSMRDNF